MRANRACLMVCLLIHLSVCPRAESDCTVGVAGGTVSADARPLLWKSRMLYTTASNEVVYFAAEPYNYIAVRCAGTYHPQMGVNSAGLCTGNSLVGADDSGDGPFTEHILRNYSTLDQVRGYIQQQRDAGTLRVSGCFPFADAAGNAAIFEIDFSNWVIEYNAMDPDRAAQGHLGWVVRANEFHSHADGSDDTSIGGRYHAGAYNIKGLIGADLLSAARIMHGDDGAEGYEFMRYGPGRPLATIAAPTVRSSMVVQGVLPGEDPALATMWIMLGHANYGITVPTWVRVSAVPEVLRNGAMFDRANSLRNKGNEAATQASVLPLEAFLFQETEALLTHWRSFGIPPAEELTRVEARMAADAYSLLSSLDAVQHDNRAPTPGISVSRMSGLTVEFAAAASDEDGRIVRYAWNFGDGNTSSTAAPAHTYGAPGWYLVSCTVMDDDTASVTDWQNYRVPKGNSDGDSDVDLDDCAVLTRCLAGPNGPPAVQDCGIFDVDEDEDVDLSDFAAFQTLFTGRVD